MLSLAACGLTRDFKIAEALLTTNCLEEIDLSNNALGQVTRLNYSLCPLDSINCLQECGLKVLQAMKTNSTVRKLDLRMSKISSETEAAIQAEVAKNRKNITKDGSRPADFQIIDFHWTEDLTAEIENALMINNQDEYAYDDYAEEESVGTPRAEFNIVVP